MSLSTQLRKTFLSTACILTVLSPYGASASHHRDCEPYYGVIDLGASMPNHATGGYHPTGWPHEAFDSSFVGGLGIGMRVAPTVRADIVASHRPQMDYSATGPVGAPAVNQKWVQSVKSSNLMFNGYYDIMPCSMVQPYISAGIGWARNQGDKVASTFGGVTYHAPKSVSHNSFAWQAGAGVAYALNASWTTDLGYHYVDLGSVHGIVMTTSTVSQKIKSDLTSHEIMLRTRYSF